MTDRIETSGKTVKDAVSEALLKMGARQDEVDIQVLEEPKSGFLGFIGNKSARVLVTKKQKRRGSRNKGYKEERSAHEFGKDNTGERGRNNPRKKPGNRQGIKKDKNEDDNRANARSRNSGSTDRGRGSRGPRPNEKRDGSSAAEPTRNETRDNRDNRDSRDNRNARKAGAPVKKQRDERKNDPRARNGNRRGRRDHEEPKNFEPQETQPMSSSQDPQRENPDEKRVGNGSENQQNQNRDRVRSGSSKPRPRREMSDNRGQNDDERPRRDVRLSSIEPDEIIKTGIVAKSYADTMRNIAEEEVCATLEEMTSAVLARAGFPSRCEVKEGEYRQIRIVTDDNSAGMLIGRHGATVDAFEHLIERMAGMAVGDRVRMNLDINNYRLRREETLAERVEMAVARVLESGRDFHIEPMCARERRIVHLKATEFEGIRTYTLTGHNGKHVVLAPGDDSDRERAREGRRDAEVEIIETPEEVLVEETVEAAMNDDGLDSAATESVEEVETAVENVAVDTGNTEPEVEDEFGDEPTIGETYREIDNLPKELDSLPDEESFSAKKKYEEGFEDTDQ